MNPMGLPVPDTLPYESRFQRSGGFRGPAPGALPRAGMSDAVGVGLVRTSRRLNWP